MSDMHFWRGKEGRHPSQITYTQSVPIPAHTWLLAQVYKPMTSTRNTTTDDAAVGRWEGTRRTRVGMGRHAHPHKRYVFKFKYIAT